MKRINTILLKTILLLIILLRSKMILFAQTYDFRNFNTEDGLAQSQVLSMCQDKYGNIWFGTNTGGASRFDGNKFTNFAESDSLIGNAVFSITETKNGKLLFGTNRGLSIFNGKTFTNYTEKNGLPHNRVFKTLQDKSEIIWIGTTRGVCQLQNNKIVSFTKDTLLNQSSVFTMYADKSGNIWFGTLGNGVIKYSAKLQKFTHYSTNEGLRYNYINAINGDLQGNIYVGTNAGISKINTSGIVEKVNINNEENIAFIGITTDNKNNQWLATSEGIYKYNGFTYKTYQIKNGLPSNLFLCVFQDREGNLWFGTDGFGVSKFSGEAFKSYSSLDGLPSDFINSIFQDSKKQMWLATKNSGVSKIVNNKIINYKLNVENIKGSLVDDDVRAIGEDNQGNLYFGTSSGLSIFDGNTFKNFYHKDGLPDENIISITKDHAGTMWIGTSDGLCYLNENKIKKVEIVNKIKTVNGNNPIYCIFEDKNNILWLGSTDGIIKYHNNIAIKYNSKNGFADIHVVSITQDKSGNLWFGTNKGIYNYDYTKFENINEKNGLSANIVYLTILDNDNNLWIGTIKGIDKFNLNLYNSNKKIEIKHFGKDNGFKGVECTRNAQFKDNEGHLWFGTIKGASVFNPYAENINKQEALTRITGIRLFFQNEDSDLNKYSKGIDSITNLPINLVLPFSKNHITFDFIGVCITNPNKVKYQFKLVGADDDWFPPTSKTEATYSSLPPGNYTFHLKAMNNDGLWNEKPVTFKFSILPPFWKTWWFISLAIIAWIIITYALMKWRIKILKKREEERIKIQKQLTEYQLTAIQAQMNPHFIFNVIASIQNFILDNETDEAYDYLAKFARLIRLILQHSKENYISIDKELDMLKLYISLEQLRLNKKFDFVVQISPQVDTISELIPVMLLQPYIENAIWHGIMPMDGSGQGIITLFIEKRNNLLIMAIDDNGIGRKKSMFFRKKQEHASMAMSLNDQRLKLFNAQIKIIDKHTDDDIPTGTRIELLIDTSKIDM